MRQRRPQPQGLSYSDEAPREEYEIMPTGEFVFNPDFYLHLVIQRIINAPHKGLESGDSEGGILMMTLAVDQLERLCRSRGWVKPEEKIVVDEDKIDGVKDASPLLKKALIANRKFELLMEKVNASAPRTGAMTLA